MATDAIPESYWVRLARLEDREEARRRVLEDVIVWLGQRDMGITYAGELCRRLNAKEAPDGN